MANRDQSFTTIGENIHTTRVLLRRGKRIAQAPDGRESVRFKDRNGNNRYLPIPDSTKRTQDYEEGRVKHVGIAVRTAMSDGVDAPMAHEYLATLVDRQEHAGAHYLDLNVDEVSLKPEEQQQAMTWLARTVQTTGSTSLSIDSSNSETIHIGLEAVDAELSGRPLLNSASLERIEVLDDATHFNARVVVTAAGDSGMPTGSDERVHNASMIIEAALAKGINDDDIFVDPLVFPISVDTDFGNHCLDAIRTIRSRFGPEIHITGGFSNVSFGMPQRRLINDAFLLLAVQAGADSGIVDPVTSRFETVRNMDLSSTRYLIAEDLLLGRDYRCKTFLRAHRKGELDEGV